MLCGRARLFVKIKYSVWWCMTWIHGEVNEFQIPELAGAYVKRKP